MSSPLSPVLWAFLPGQISHLLVPYLSSFLPRIFPPAPKNTQAYQRNYKLAYTLVVVGYLAYTFLSSSTSGPELQDWYAVLGVPVDVDDDGLKRAYRGLRYHPDRSSASAEIFIYIRQAYEGLSDPVKRFVYDRFGPGAMEWKAASYREYMRQGTMQSAGFYGFSALFMLGLPLIGRAREGQYWRNTLFALLFLAESSLLFSTSPVSTAVPPVLASVLPVLAQPPFLQIRFLHRVFTGLSIGITQLAGIWVERPNEDRIMAELQSVVQQLHLEAGGAFQETVIPLLQRGNPLQAERLLLRGMEQALVDRAISTHPQIRPFWQEAIARAQSAPKRARQAYPTYAQADALYPKGYAPSPYHDTTSWHTEKHSPRSVRVHDLRAVEEDLMRAREVPLPDSPPGSPVLSALAL